tara:strand:- start:164 stop:355 length:192 start_codon:yes stop_codon:yes gene_type:complete
MNKKDKKNISYYFDFSEVLTYFFRKKDPNKKVDFSLKMMHGVNKISIIIFLLGVIYIVVKRFL